MEGIIYKIALVAGALANLAMATGILAHQKKYRRYTIYFRARQFTALWLIAFAVGYLIHAVFEPRLYWPTMASALTVSYFHLGAICFCWGYIPLLNPDYFTRRIAVRDTIIYVIGLTAYWTVAMLWKNAPLYTLLSYGVFFAYCIYNLVVFYKTYHRVSFRLLKMSYGNVSAFVRWMQVSCDLIIFFGMCGVAMTALFPENSRIPFTVLTLLGIGVWAYIVYSISKYGTVVETATRATENVAATEPLP